MQRKKIFENLFALCTRFLQWAVQKNRLQWRFFSTFANVKPRSSERVEDKNTKPCGFIIYIKNTICLCLFGSVSVVILQKLGLLYFSTACLVRRLPSKQLSGWEILQTSFGGDSLANSKLLVDRTGSKQVFWDFFHAKSMVFVGFACCSYLPTFRLPCFPVVKLGRASAL